MSPISPNLLIVNGSVMAMTFARSIKKGIWQGESCNQRVGGGGGEGGGAPTCYLLSYFKFRCSISFFTFCMLCGNSFYFEKKLV